MKKVKTAYLSLGSNLGNRAQNISNAVNLIKNHPNIYLEKVSSYYETSPVGPKQPNFINSVLRVRTTLPARQLLNEIKLMEKALGREHSQKRWGPRVIDIDILFYGKAEINTPALKVPHPRFVVRRFAVEPLFEIAPHFSHPVLKVTAKTLSSKLKKTHPEQKIKVVHKKGKRQNNT
jgi:2-amino-4-hydroxy-6-hydroxymethyldihydropteridine diphosphokinase